MRPYRITLWATQNEDKEGKYSLPFNRAAGVNLSEMRDRAIS
jgi:hypothetical protein